MCSITHVVVDDKIEFVWLVAYIQTQAIHMPPRGSAVHTPYVCVIANGQDQCSSFGLDFCQQWHERALMIKLSLSGSWRIYKHMLSCTMRQFLHERIHMPPRGSAVHTPHVCVIANGQDQCSSFGLDTCRQWHEKAVHSVFTIRAVSRNGHCNFTDSRQSADLGGIRPVRGSNTASGCWCVCSTNAAAIRTARHKICV